MSSDSTWRMKPDKGLSEQTGIALAVGMTQIREEADLAAKTMRSLS